MGGAGLSNQSPESSVRLSSETDHEVGGVNVVLPDRTGMCCVCNCFQLSCIETSF